MKQKMSILAKSKRQINIAIKHLGLEIQNNMNGYSYFTHIEDGTDLAGHVVGESIYVCYLNQQTVGEWVKDAEIAMAMGPSCNQLGW